jgi:hypothetical protein
VRTEKSGKAETDANRSTACSAVPRRTPFAESAVPDGSTLTDADTNKDTDKDTPSDHAEVVPPEDSVRSETQAHETREQRSAYRETVIRDLTSLGVRRDLASSIPAEYDRKVREGDTEGVSGSDESGRAPRSGLEHSGGI